MKFIIAAAVIVFTIYVIKTIVTILIETDFSIEETEE